MRFRKQFSLLFYSIVGIAFVLSFFFLQTNTLTFFAVESSLDDGISLPPVEEGNEIEHLGYKYSNTSGIIVTTIPSISCRWKPDQLDDGWKTCESTFEVENLGDDKPVLTAPNIRFDFLNDANIRNIEISYSEEYDVVAEEITNETTRVVEQTVHEPTVEEESFATAGITGRTIDDEELVEGEAETRNITLVKPEVIQVQKRKFNNFNAIPSFTVSIDTTNETEQNETNVTIDDTNVSDIIVNNETNETIVGNETNVTDDSSNGTVIEDQNETVIVEGNETNNNMTEINETAIEEQGSEGSDGATETNETTEENVEDAESIQNDTGTIQNADAGGQEGDTAAAGNDSILEGHEEGCDPGAIEETPLEEFVEAILEVEVGEEDCPGDHVSQEVEVETSEPSADDGFSVGFSSGFVISGAEEERAGINTGRSFAIRIAFELPKYETNQFNFDIQENSFHAFIDPSVSSCGTLDSQNGVYTLTQDVSASGTCFSISAPNITLDCQGYAINYSGSGNTNYGVYINASDATVQDCDILKTNHSTSSAYGIYVFETGNATITNNTIINTGISGVSDMGMLFDTASDNLINENSITVMGGSGPYGVYLQSSSRANRFINNSLNVSGSSDSLAMYVSDNSNNVILENLAINASGLSGYAAFFESVSNTIFENSTIELYGGLSYGLFSESATGSQLRHNVFNHSANAGEILSLQSGSPAVLFYNNTLWSVNASVNGFQIESSSNISIIDNVVVTAGSQAHGIKYSGVTNSRVTNNTLSTRGNDAHGAFFSFSSDNNTFTNNSIGTSGDEGYGFSVSASGENKFINNSVVTTGSGSDGHNIIGSSNHNFFTGSNITLNADNAIGIYVGTSINSSFDKEAITTRGLNAYGIYLRFNTTNTTFSEVHVATNGSGSHGIFMGPGRHIFSLNDSVLNASASGTSAIHAGEGISVDVPEGEWNLTNVTYNSINWSSVANGTLQVMWHVDVFAYHLNGSVLGDVNVSGFDVTGTEHFSALTNGNGSIMRQHVLAIRQNGSSASDTTYYSNYTINATLSDASETVDVSVNLTDNQNLSFLFGNASETEDAGSGGSGGGGGGGGGGGAAIAKKNNSTNSSQGNKGGNDNRRNRRAVLFDINLRILNDQLSVKETLLGAIGLINLGVPGEVQATLYYEVRDDSGSVVYEETEQLPVQTQKEFIKHLDVSGLAEGEYELFVDLTYEGQLEPATTQAHFSVHESESTFSRFGISLIVIAILFGIFVTSSALYQTVCGNKRIMKRFYRSHAAEKEK